MRIQNYTFWCLIFISCFFSCKKEVDFDSLENPNYEGEWQVPLIKTHITFQELIEEANQYLNIDFIYDEESELFTLIHRDSIAASVPEEYYKLTDHNFSARIKMPDQQIPSEYEPIVDDHNTVPPGTDPHTFDTTFIVPIEDVALDRDDEVIEGAQIDYMILDNGQMLINIKNNFEHPVDITLTLSSIETTSGEPVKTSTTVEPNTSRDITIPLTGRKLILEGDNENPNTFEATATFTLYPIEGNTLSEEDYIDLSFEIKDMNYDLVVGQLGEFTVPIPEGSLELNLFDDVDKNADIQLEDAGIDLQILNSSGVPMNLDIEQLDFITADESNESVSYDNDEPISINYVEDVSQRGDEATTTYSINNSNTQNLRSIFSLAPEKLAYKLNVDVAGSTGQQNFLAKESQVGVIAEAKIPLHGSVSHYFVSDTFSIDLAVDLADEDTIVEQAQLKIVCENTLPFDIYNQSYFLDEDRNVIDSLFHDGLTQLLASSQVNEEGLLLTPSKKVITVNISRKRYADISKSAYLVTHIRFRSAEGGDIPVKVIGSYGFTLGMGISAKFDADLN